MLPALALVWVERAVGRCKLLQVNSGFWDQLNLRESMQDKAAGGAIAGTAKGHKRRIERLHIGLARLGSGRQRESKDVRVHQCDRDFRLAIAIESAEINHHTPPTRLNKFTTVKLENPEPLTVILLPP